MGTAIQQDLANRDLFPGTYLLDSGYVDADFLVTAQTKHQMDVIRPPLGPIAGNVLRDKAMTYRPL